MNSLFSISQTDIKNNKRPLADMLRPDGLDFVYGQNHLLDKNGPLGSLIGADYLPSIILWGPPGCGKTTIAKIIAKESGYELSEISAVTGGAQDLKKIFNLAKENLKIGKKTLILVDEIHRFNRAQQDLFLPFIEDGTITLIGATTENPSFELNGALLSRCKVLVLKSLNQDSLEKILTKVEDFYQQKLPLTEDAKNLLCSMADGDGRYLLNMCEDIINAPDNKEFDSVKLLNYLNKRAPLYDKSQDSHYNLISALHKSLRGSDVDASLYWFARMLNGGEDPLYIARRLVRFASEDIGLADPNALTQAIAAKQAFEQLGSPEGELAIAQSVIYLATAPKSNAAYKAFKNAVKDAKNNSSYMPPKHILNAPTKLMKEQGYKEGYIYDHDTKEGFSGQNYFPDEMQRKKYYNPPKRGFEREILKRISYWDKLRSSKK